MRRQIGADLALLLVTAIWGGTFVMVKDAVEQYPVFPFLALRVGLATLVLRRRQRAAAAFLWAARAGPPAA